MKLKAPDFSPKQLRRIIRSELEEHPKSRYEDLYKLIHQAYFGPSHLEGSVEELERGIWDEIRNLRGCVAKPLQDIGLGKAFIRLNFFSLAKMPSLKLSRTNTLQEQLIHDALMRVTPDHVRQFAQAVHYSRLPESFDHQKWLAVWKTVNPIILSHIFPTIAERSRIEYYLASATMPSHSEDYKYLYKPHYRVIHIKFRPKFKA